MKRMILESIQNEPDAKARASFKGQEIAKLGAQARQNVKFSGQDFDIEIVSMSKIEGGLEVFARAWVPGGSQIGFGPRGTIDIERFRILNPPIMVTDGTKRTVTVNGKDDEIDNFKEDALQSTLQTLCHIIGVKKHKVTSNPPIVPGSIGNTTSTFFPDADPETTSVDGISTFWVTLQTFAAARASAAGNDTRDNTENPSNGFSSGVAIGLSTDGGGGFAISRAFTLFDTSAIPDADTITSATLSLFIYNKAQSFGNDGNDFISIITTTPASNTAIVDADYDQVGTTEQHDTAQRKDISGVSTGAYLDFTFNSTGLGNISKTGVSKFGAREGHDLLNAEPTGGNTLDCGVAFYNAERSGTSNDPKLVVEHGSAAAPRVYPNLLMMGVG